MSIAVIGLALLLLILTGCGYVGSAIGRSKGHAGVGFALGFCLTFIGWIIVAVLPPTEAVRRMRDEELAHAIAEAAATQTTVPGEIQPALADDARSLPENGVESGLGAALAPEQDVVSVDTATASLGSEADIHPSQRAQLDPAGIGRTDQSDEVTRPDLIESRPSHKASQVVDKPSPMAPAAGWYSDPDAPEALRYWDGTAWTDHRHPKAPTGPAAGWYDDPHSTGQLRYWDGGRWTESVAGKPDA